MDIVLYTNPVKLKSYLRNFKFFRIKAYNYLTLHYNIMSCHSSYDVADLQTINQATTVSRVKFIIKYYLELLCFDPVTPMSHHEEEFLLTTKLSIQYQPDKL